MCLFSSFLENIYSKLHSFFAKQGLHILKVNGIRFKYLLFDKMWKESKGKLLFDKICSKVKRIKNSISSLTTRTRPDIDLKKSLLCAPVRMQYIRQCAPKPLSLSLSISFLSCFYSFHVSTLFLLSFFFSFFPSFSFSVFFFSFFQRY